MVLGAEIKVISGIIMTLLPAADPGVLTVMNYPNLMQEGFQFRMLFYNNVLVLNQTRFHPKSNLHGQKIRINITLVENSLCIDEDLNFCTGCSIIRIGPKL